MFNHAYLASIAYEISPFRKAMLYKLFSRLLTLKLNAHASFQTSTSDSEHHGLQRKIKCKYKYYLLNFKINF